MRQQELRYPCGCAFTRMDYEWYSDLCPKHLVEYEEQKNFEYQGKFILEAKTS